MKMRKQKNFLSSLHKSTLRNYLARMNNNKVDCMTVAKKYSYDYWDGDRKYGYGGYKYIQDRWTPLAKKIIKTYKLNNNSKVMDLGCGKGFLLYEIKKLLPNINIYGCDKSSYAIKSAKNKFKNLECNLFVHDLQNKLSFKKKFFDLIISINTLHNLKIFDLKNRIRDINKLSKKSYIVVESYRNNSELFNLQCWALTCESFFSTEEWIWLFNDFKYRGDYEFIYFD